MSDAVTTCTRTRAGGTKSVAHLDQPSELRRHLVGELQRGLARGHGGLLHLLPVLVRAGEEVHLAAVGAVESSHDIATV